MRAPTPQKKFQPPENIAPSGELNFKHASVLNMPASPSSSFMFS